VNFTINQNNNNFINMTS